MVKTKITPRKTVEVRHVLSCLLCQEEFLTEEQLKTHLLQCVKHKAPIKCEQCSKTFKRHEYLRRHLKNIHGQGTSKDAVTNSKVKSAEFVESEEDNDSLSEDEGSVQSETVKESEAKELETSEKDDLERYDPGNLIGEVSSDHESQVDVESDAENNTEERSEDRHERVVEVNEVEIGRTVRRKTSPLPVMAPLKRKDIESVTEPVNSIVDDAESVSVDTQTNKIQERDQTSESQVQTSDKGTQTSVARERKRVKITTKYMENGRKVEMVEEHETEWLI